MYEAGENCPSTPQATYDNLECDGYYGFSSMGNVKMTVTNFAVQENGKKCSKTILRKVRLCLIT